MKRKIRSAVILCAVICAVMLLLCTAVSAAGTVVASGYCGGDTSAEYDATSESYKNLTWTLDSTGLLTISGTGEMMDYNRGRSTPYNSWYSTGTSIKSVTIDSGVTSIGDDAFYNCGSLTGVTIPDGVTSVGNAAFYPCRNLKDIYITDLDAWCRISFGDDYANPLSYARNLYLNGEKVELPEIPESVQVISSNLFYNAGCIKAVSIPRTLIGVAANAFKNCTGIEKVFFAGSEAEREDLAISAGNEPVDATLPIDNSSGRIASLRAFVVGSLSDPAPLGNAVSFGTF